jgi:hypothetical protein
LQCHQIKKQQRGEWKDLHLPFSLWSKGTALFYLRLLQLHEKRIFNLQGDIQFTSHWKRVGSHIAYQAAHFYQLMQQQKSVRYCGNKNSTKKLLYQLSVYIFKYVGFLK